MGSVHCALDVTGTFTSPRSALTASSYTGATTHYANSIVHPRQQRADHNWHLDNIPMANSHTYSAPIVDQSIALLFPIIEVFVSSGLKPKAVPARYYSAKSYIIDMQPPMHCNVSHFPFPCIILLMRRVENYRRRRADPWRNPM